ncbi:MAG: thiamine ABC transporter substrate-binding protein [Anaerolineaceae bacterium]|nr:thiamine ABC transporter substrate-binding protein [Anaerolineaceae bacterium]
MKKRFIVFNVVFLVGLFMLSGCKGTEQTSSDVQTLTVMTHDSFAISEDVIAQFETQNNVKVEFIKSGDTGAALNRAVLTKDTPIADVFYGVDNTFLSRAVDAGIFEPYASPKLAEIPEAFKLDASNGALPMDYGDVCINYDKAYFIENELAIPQTLDDLTLEEYKGLLVVENPVTSSPGLAFLLATISAYGDDFPTFWEALKANEVHIVNDWETAYYTNFSGSSGQGAQPMVVSYGTSPAAEVIFAETVLTEAPTASLVGDQMCFRQIEFIGILAGTENRSMAEKFVDFALDVPMQEDLPMQMFVNPVNQNAALPEEFDMHTQSPDMPANLEPDQIAENREAWLEIWDSTMLR